MRPITDKKNPPGSPTLSRRILNFISAGSDDSVKVNAQRPGDALAIILVRLQAVFDVADLDHVGDVAHRPRGVPEKGLLLLGLHQAEQVARLRVIIGVVLPIIPLVGRAVELQRRLLVLALLLPLAEAVGLVAQRRAVIAVDTHLAIAVIHIKEWATAAVDRNLVMVHAQAITLRVAV